MKLSLGGFGRKGKAKRSTKNINRRKFTPKQERQKMKIEKKYTQNGVPKKRARSIAFATVQTKKNKSK